MNENQIICHLEDLKKEAEGHFTDDGDDEIFHQDAEALQAAAEAVKQNKIIADAINSEIANCNREIRKVDIEKAKAEERRMNYGDRRTMLMELLVTIKGGRKMIELDDELKPCPYCDFSVRNIGERMKPGSDPFILIKDEGQVFIATDDSSFVILPINYCPMCGRNLKQEGGR